MAGMAATTSSRALGQTSFLPSPQVAPASKTQARALVAYVSTSKAPRLITATARPVVTASLLAMPAKSARHVINANAAASGNSARFDAVVKKASLTSQKLASLFDHPGSARSQLAAVPASERFASQPDGSADPHPTVLAYADPSPGGAADSALSVLLATPPEEDLALQEQAPDTDTDAAATPDYQDTPSDGPMPQLRPLRDQALGQAPGPAAVEEPRKAYQREEPKQTLAYARPNVPEPKASGSLGQSLRNLFGGGSRAGDGVAVYDISAAKVYMPDGSVLEAHSGVGSMADDPRYVNVKMNGPTPPHTYNLKMRESRFHGVEAIRMLPVDGKNKYGRDGFLTHSYLLRGRQAESHGCVAFKDYQRFLTAFKQGKVRQIVVVPSGGRANTRLASNGKSA
ncbi:uncharacterized protein DUF2778 [Aminobacter sp. AP02]|nr:uncharacterized protein DUF2778 [Aminobacter sp. AP02]